MKRPSLTQLDESKGYEWIKLAREMKYPYPWTPKRSRIVFLFKILGKVMQGSPSVFFADGGHFIDGPTGAGKTAMMNYLLEIMLGKDGFAWCNIDEFKYKHVRSFDLYDLFKDGKQQYRLDNIDDEGRKCRALVLDEINSEFNRRQNHQREYNDIFVPLIKMLVTLRNASNIPKFYLIGQSVLLQDSQLQEVIKYRHYIQSKKGWGYWFWRNELKVIKVPKKIKVQDFVKVGTDEKGNAVWKRMTGKHIVKIPPWTLETFDTHAFGKLIEDLPLYTKKKKKE